MVLLSEVKAEMNLTAAMSGDDTLISKSIDVALQYVAAESVLSQAASGGGFEEWFDGNIDEFTLSLRTNDINITSVTAYDDDGNATNVTDYVKLGSRTWILTGEEPTAVKYRVIYGSNYGQRAMDQIVTEVAIWEYLKMPNKTGSLNKTASVVGQNNISYKIDADFYNEVKRRIGKLVLPAC